MQSTRRMALLGIAAATSADLAFGRPAYGEEPAGFAADIDLLQRIYETLHPGLYRYQTPAHFAERCAAVKAEAGTSADLPTQYRLLSKLLAQVRCGHTYANFFNQTAAASKVIVAPKNKLPFHFVWIGDRMVVADNPLGIDGLARGDEVLSIDGAPAAAVQAALLPYMRADGSNDDKRRVLLDVTGVDKIESFDVFHPLLFPKADLNFTLLRREARTGAVRLMKVEPIDHAGRRAMAPKAADPSTPDYWSLAWPTPAVAVLTMPGWAVYDVKWDWRARIAALMEEVSAKGAQGLVIDLRDNEGGDDCGYEIISRLIDSDLPLFADGERLVRFRSTPKDINPYLDTWDRSFEHLGEGADDLANGFYRLKADDDDVKRIKPRAPRFRGKVIVLSGAQNSSATFQFIALMRRSGLARIYGGPTGGNQRGINGGSFFFVRLPNTGLEADLPLVGFFPNQPKPDAGLWPDVRIDRTLADVARGYDRVLAQAVADLG
jgi:hypothetical protein